MGEGRDEGSSAVGDEGKLQFHSCLMLMAQVLVLCWNQMQAPILESSQLEGSYVGDLLYIFFSDLYLLMNRMRCFRVISESQMPNHPGLNLSTDLYHLYPTECLEPAG